MPPVYFALHQVNRHLSSVSIDVRLHGSAPRLTGQPVRLRRSEATQGSARDLGSPMRSLGHVPPFPGLEASQITVRAACRASTGAKPCLETDRVAPLELVQKHFADLDRT